MEKENQLKEDRLKLIEQGNKYFAEKKYKEAIEEYSKVLELISYDAEALMQRGFAKYKNSPSFGTASDLIDKSGALKDFFDALSIDSSVKELLSTTNIAKDSISTLLNNKAWKNISNKEFELAFKQLSLALLLTPSYGMAMLTMAEGYTALKKDEEALDWLEKAVELYPQFAKDIDGYDCYKSLHSYERYQRIIGNKSLSEKSFYVLEMYVERGGMNENLRFVSADLGRMEQFMVASIKGNLGFYKLLSYGQRILLHRIEKGKTVSTLNLLQFIRLCIPGMLNATFNQLGEADIRDMEGNIQKQSWEETVIKKHKSGASYEVKKTRQLSDYLWEYHAFSEKEETFFITPYKDKIGELCGIPLAEGESAEIENYSVIGELGGELNSGETFSLEEYVEIMRENRV